jgi:hypothetical protein
MARMIRTCLLAIAAGFCGNQLDRAERRSIGRKNLAIHPAGLRHHQPGAAGDANLLNGVMQDP